MRRSDICFIKKEKEGMGLEVLEVVVEKEKCHMTFAHEFLHLE